MAWCRGQAVTASAKSPQHRITPRRIVPGKRSGGVSHPPDAPIDPPGPSPRGLSQESGAA